MRNETVLPFKLEMTDEKLTAHGGLVLAHEFHVGLGVDRLLDEMVPGPGSNRGHRVSEVVLPVVLMLQGGGRDLEDIAVIEKDAALREAAGSCGERASRDAVVVRAIMPSPLDHPGDLYQEHIGCWTA